MEFISITGDGVWTAVRMRSIIFLLNPKPHGGLRAGLDSKGLDLLRIGTKS